MAFTKTLCLCSTYISFLQYHNVTKLSLTLIFHPLDGSIFKEMYHVSLFLCVK